MGRPGGGGDVARRAGVVVYSSGGGRRSPRTGRTALDCPDCRRPLARVTSATVEAHRCPRCRGIWLDPASFRQLCEDEARPPDQETALAARPVAARGPGAPREVPPAGRVRYRPCPACGELMNRDNFGRVSGVILDVCRPHGAWLDRGELAAIRRFLREGGARRFERLRALDEERAAGRDDPQRPSPSPDLAEVLLAGEVSFDVPSRFPWLPVAIACAILGGGLTWNAVAGDGGEPALTVGLGALALAWGAARRWLDRRGR